MHQAGVKGKLVTALVLAGLLVVLAACGGGSSQPAGSTGGESGGGGAGGYGPGYGSGGSSGAMGGHGSHPGGDAGSAPGGGETGNGETGGGETGGTGSEQGGSEAGAPAVVEVRVDDFRFNPEDITIPAGVQVTFRVRNVGRAPHTFTVTELGVDVALEPGQSAEVTVDPVPAGLYTLVCLYHPGMVGTVIVEDE